VSGEALVAIALASRACLGPLCCWEVRLDDGTLYQDEQGPEARFEIPRQGRYFEVRARPGTCGESGVWSDWSRVEWLHPTDIDADGVVGLPDYSGATSRVEDELGRIPEASEYLYCRQPDPVEP
jgi:hypothetical protein